MFAGGRELSGRPPLSAIRLSANRSRWSWSFRRFSCWSDFFLALWHQCRAMPPNNRTRIVKRMYGIMLFTLPHDAWDQTFADMAGDPFCEGFDALTLGGAGFLGFRGSLLLLR